MVFALDEMLSAVVFLVFSDVGYTCKNYMVIFFSLKLDNIKLLAESLLT
jgi:hypothetical protein